MTGGGLTKLVLPAEKSEKPVLQGLFLQKYTMEHFTKETQRAWNLAKSRQFFLGQFLWVFRCIKL